MQHSCWRGPFWPSLLGLLATRISFDFSEVEAMEVEAEERWITVPEGRPENTAITVPSAEDRCSDDSS